MGHASTPCALIEVLAGRHAFQKETRTDTLAAILHVEPDWEAVPRSTPTKAHDLMRRCLQKDVQRRLRDIGDARIELEGMEAVPTAAQSIATIGGRNWRIAWIAAALGCGSRSTKYGRCTASMESGQPNMDGDQ